jgi:CO dehydrogenase/acetyl-CoA synthase gamma subunit (corrinoid Fe-S protein)
MKENCATCGVETPYDFETHIDERNCYIEGVGQLCRQCFDKGGNRNQILVPVSIIKNTSNNYDLGEKVRSLYNEIY